LESNGLENRLDAVAVGSGMAAIAVALMSEMNAGDHLVAAHDCYGTTLTFVRDDLSRFGITSSIVDFQDLDAVKSAVTDRTRVLLCEMCTNPLIRVPDLEALAGIAHEAGALLLVDTTVPTSSRREPGQLSRAREQPLLRPSPEAAASRGRRPAVLRTGRRQACPRVDDPPAPAGAVDAEPRKRHHHHQPPGVDLAPRAPCGRARA